MSIQREALEAIRIALDNGLDFAREDLQHVTVCFGRGRKVAAARDLVKQAEDGIAALAALSAPTEQVPPSSSEESEILRAFYAVQGNRAGISPWGWFKEGWLAASPSAPTAVQPAEDALTPTERAACQQCGSDPHKMSCSVGGKTQLRLTADEAPTAVQPKFKSFDELFAQIEKTEGYQREKAAVAAECEAIPAMNEVLGILKRLPRDKGAAGGWTFGRLADVLDGAIERLCATPTAVQPAKLKRGTTGKCSRRTGCECDAEGLGDECVWLVPTTTPTAVKEAGGVELTTRNCRWSGEQQVQWCGLHDAHREAIHEWAARAKAAEAALARAAQPATPVAPIDMVLHCQECGMQHIDMPERSLGPGNTESLDWDNPPHRSHLCHGCGHIWRPADVPTNGVEAVKTKGKADSPIAAPVAPSIEIDFKQAAELLEMFGGEPTVIRLQAGDASSHSGPGLYAWYDELPEEGANFLGLADDEALPAASMAPTITFVGVDPLQPAHGAATPLLRDSWRFGFDRRPDGSYRFGFRDDGPFVLYEATPVAPKTLEALTDVDAFLGEVRAELVRARTKFPGDRIMTIALAEEFGELCKAVLDESAANVRKEAVQTAVMAARVVLDGDGSVREWRAERGLDALATKNGMTLGTATQGGE